MEFKPGDEVQLKSGGPSMTVEGYGTFQGKQKVRCKWFDGKQLQDEVFVPELLVKCEGRVDFV